MLFRSGKVESEEVIKDFNRTIIRLGEDLHKPVIATGDVHFTEPEDAIYRSLDWETNPPINGFYEMMMSLTPERRAELRRLGREKMDANAAKQAERAAEAKKEERQATEMEQPSSVRPFYPVENGFEAEGKAQIERVEREMREEEAALTPEERQRRKEEAMMPRPFKGIMEPHLKDGSLDRKSVV